ncbi:unnamed protein product [Rotaria socialis]|uniref:Uncharacterized protein n=2 Tax=Rotaria socialis TaxID=392032 RepID=A0A820DSJ9_9BILA|nr:unnamed protein product [Rotaria socialis]CAF4394302.1 unnamed protein product [Rotaria socialis]CAF4488958.1 unnamed protein product [Rotaria socialis]
MYQHQQGHLHNDIFDELINLLTAEMEKIIEETTKRLFKSLQQKIKKSEQTISSVETLINDDTTSSSSSFSDSDEDIKIVISTQHYMEWDQQRQMQEENSCKNYLAKILSSVSTMILQTFEKNEYEAKLDWILGSQPLLSFIRNVETHPTIGTINGYKPLIFDIQIGAERGLDKYLIRDIDTRFKRKNDVQVKNA